MAKLLRCRDLGFDCDGVVRGNTDEEVLRQGAAHAREVHGLDEIPDDVARRVKDSIRDEPSSPSGV